MKIAVTGHRPHHLNNEYDGIGPVSKWIKKKINDILDIYEPNMLISGMALGVDMLFAEMAIERDLDLLAAIPCNGQDSRWPQKSKNRYNKILSYKNCKKVVIAKSYSPWVMQQRNKYMIDNCDVLIAVWNGSSGGTCNAVQHAEKTSKKMIKINPLDCNAVKK